MESKTETTELTLKNDISWEKLHYGLMMKRSPRGSTLSPHLEESPNVMLESHQENQGMAEGRSLGAAAKLSLRRQTKNLTDLRRVVM